MTHKLFFTDTWVQVDGTGVDHPIAHDIDGIGLFEFQPLTPTRQANRFAGRVGVEAGIGLNIRPDTQRAGEVVRVGCAVSQLWLHAIVQNCLCGDIVVTVEAIKFAFTHQHNGAIADTGDVQTAPARTIFDDDGQGESAFTTMPHMNHLCVSRRDCTFQQRDHVVAGVGCQVMQRGVNGGLGGDFAPVDATDAIANDSYLQHTVIDSGDLINPGPVLHMFAFATVIKVECCITVIRHRVVLSAFRSLGR